jgi:hypothetical protein
MKSVAELMHMLRRRVEADPQRAARVGACFGMAVEGEGGHRYWLVRLREPAAVIETDRLSPEAECQVRSNEEHLGRFLEGKVSAQQLFFAGQLQLEGQLGLARKLCFVRELLE